MAKNQKWYVVWSGVAPGIYTTWKECEAQVKGFSGAKYKSYPTEAEAEDAFTAGSGSLKRGAVRAKMKDVRSALDIEEPKSYLDSTLYKTIPWEKYSISVDAACSGNPGEVEYQVVNSFTKKVIKKFGPFEMGTNNVGEFLALVEGIKFIDSLGKQDPIPIYTDSKTGLAWLKKKRCNTTVKIGAELESLVKDASDLLRLRDLSKYDIRKWDTKNWGEIPADFGRK